MRRCRLRPLVARRVARLGVFPPTASPYSLLTVVNRGYQGRRYSGIRYWIQAQQCTVTGSTAVPRLQPRAQKSGHRRTIESSLSLSAEYQRYGMGT
jgi:hypothetical protein